MKRAKTYAVQGTLALLICASLLSALSCGRKGEPIVPGTVVPEAVGDLMAESREGVVILSWSTPSRDTSGAPLGAPAGFRVMRAPVPEGEEGCPCEFAQAGLVDMELPKDAVVSGGRVAWTDRDTALRSGTRYAYKVSALGRDGYAGADSEAAYVTPLTPPAAPSGLTALPGEGSVALSWDRVDADAGGTGVPDVAGYNVYRLASEDAPLGGPVNRGLVADTAYADTGLEDGRRYFYRVAALRGASAPYTEGAPSVAVAAIPRDVTPPSPPSGLQAVPSEGYVLLSWLPSPEPDTAGYMLYRKGPDDDAPVKLLSVPTDRLTYRDNSVRPGASYAYSVSALDDAVPPNEGARSDEAAVNVPR